MISFLRPYHKLKDHAARVIRIEAEVVRLADALDRLTEGLRNVDRIGVELTDLASRVDYGVTQVDHVRVELASLADRVEVQFADLAKRLEKVDRIAVMARDSASLGVRNRPVRPPYRVAFLVHNFEAWYSLADVYREMAASDQFVTLVASIPRRYPGSAEFRDEDRVHAALTEYGVPHIRLNHPDAFMDLAVVRAFAPDVVFRQSQWETDVPEAFSAPALAFARLCLVPYEAMSLIASPVDPGEPNPVYDSDYDRSAWRVFHANEYSREAALAEAPSAIAGRHLVTGHPKGDVIPRESLTVERGDAPFSVLWSAHHAIGDGWNRFGTFPTTAFDMVQAARSHPEWRFVLSLHPAMVTVMESAEPPLSREFVDRFWNEWNALPNTEVYPGGRYAELFARSDVLVSDGVSWLLEFQLLNRPVVFLERPDHRAMSEAGEIARAGVNPVASVAEAVGLLERLAAGHPDSHASDQREIVATLFGQPGAAHRIVEAIKEGLASE